MVVAVLLVGLAACSTGQADAPPPSPAVASVPDPAGDGVLRILFLGNSHTAHHDVPGTVAALIRPGRPGVRVVAVREPSLMHLQERARHRPTLDLIDSRPWDYVVLQAQNYSTSGRYSYPSDGAESLVHRVRQRGAVAVLYAEWARRGIDETGRILDAYGRVAAAGPACLPPVPEAFDRAAPLGLTLLAQDGNHSSPEGAFLASAVLAGALLDEDVAGLPAVPGISGDVQRELRGVADAALDRVDPSRRCPALRP